MFSACQINIHNFQSWCDNAPLRVGYSTRPCRKWYSETAFSRRDVPFSARSSAISNISRRPRMAKIQWKALWIFMAGLLSRTAARCGMFFFEAVAVCRTVFTRYSLNTFIAVRYSWIIAYSWFRAYVRVQKEAILGSVLENRPSRGQQLGSCLINSWSSRVVERHVMRPGAIGKLLYPRSLTDPTLKPAKFVCNPWPTELVSRVVAQ